MAKKARKTAKSLTKAAKKGLSKAPKGTFWDTFPKNEIERLEYMLKLTIRARDRFGSHDNTMQDQAERLIAQIETLKAQK